MQVAVYACMAAMFWPITVWLASSTEGQSRLLNALGVLIFATALLLKFSTTAVNSAFSLNNAASRTLYATFILILLQIVGNYFTDYAAFSLLGIPAYACGIASLLLFVFGESTKRIVITSTTTFGCFLLLSTCMQTVDWPLRTIAGKLSEGALKIIGQSTQLGILDTANAPDKLILFVNERPFHVASECNGFGVILSCLLIACMLSIYHRICPLHFALNLLLGVAIGFALNTLRIVIIILLAPVVMDHYDLMHEVIGTITYWSALILSWIALKGPTRLETTESIA